VNELTTSRRRWRKEPTVKTSLRRTNTLAKNKCNHEDAKRLAIFGIADENAL
jgi:hypothetical protein